ncbi:hypothetical protein, partial [Sphingobacterium thalpophilum]|uniref:hypothetical protein n=1 Tax=Sphingobacterium thalpophilum TaxID=259 RepID=UPI003C772D2D
FRHDDYKHYFFRSTTNRVDGVSGSQSTFLLTILCQQGKLIYFRSCCAHSSAPSFLTSTTVR